MLMYDNEYNSGFSQHNLISISSQELPKVQSSGVAAGFWQQYLVQFAKTSTRQITTEQKGTKKLYFNAFGILNTYMHFKINLDQKTVPD